MNKTIKKGDRGEEVRMLQKYLGMVADGVFGSLTDKAVKIFQNEHGLEVDGIVGEKTWGALMGNTPSTTLKKSRRNIKEIIVHCSATAEGKEYAVNDIRRWHKERGWSDIGYHYVIYLDGTVHTGRDVNVAGAHCTGHNAYSIGVCYIGGCDKTGKNAKDTRTEAQKDALVKLLKELRKLYPNAKIHSHRDFASKACPSFDATKEYANL